MSQFVDAPAPRFDSLQGGCNALHVTCQEGHLQVAECLFDDKVSTHCYGHIDSYVCTKQISFAGPSNLGNFLIKLGN